ncbi:glycerol transporter [Saxophila tyrrhenica]|uniref:Glycerol transporter n=1 Tax=Saxophila tyrrhenica TaxID=1690608 RepID=A0AAV9PH93_9PEZI|nr:glycerol transporter [Saxophila tyrrhenica]
MMNPLSLFKVENLDTRFRPKNPQPLPNAQPSRWNTPEYYIYALVFLTIPPLMFKSVYDVSQPDHPNYARYSPLLSQGWIPGRLVDNSDLQYRGFRGNIPYLALLLVLHPVARRAYDFLRSGGNSGPGNGSAVSKKKDETERDAADSRLRGRIRFDLVFAMIFLLVLHGISILKVLLIVYINFQIPTKLSKQYATVATWVFNIGIMFANELCGGYSFARMFALFLPTQMTNADSKGPQAIQSDWGAWLDSYGGLTPRWEILFNVTVLRMIAFNFDYLWMLDRRESSPIEKKNLDPTDLPEKERVKSGASPNDFSLTTYLAYTLYSPLYLAGPIVTFNDYISQCRHPLRTLDRSYMIPYAIRFLICLLTMELCLHFLYAVAISKSNPDWTTYTPFQLSMLGYFNLHIIWLKLLVPWRFFRLWALVDGIDPPENMVRCMSDNYSTLAFWRGWHRSFNLWIVRYIYLPLGGSRVSTPRAIGNFIAVFTFVALWHDINLRLLAWGWLVVLFILPELIASYIFPAKKYEGRPDLYRWLCGFGAVGNILMMMVSSLVGFAFGLDGLKGFVDGIVGSLGGRVFMLAACMTLFVGSQVMFEVREAERRRGVAMKC